MLVLIGLSLTSAAYSQKTKVTYDKETGMIEVNGESYAYLSKENAPGQLGINKNFTISNLNGDELIYLAFQQEEVRDAWGNKKETKTFYKITFLESNRSSRKNGTMTASGAARLIAKNNLIVDGKIDADAERKFHLKY